MSKQPTGSKRKRDSRDEDTHKRKKPSVALRKRYQTVRTVEEVLVNGANLKTGHISGVLKEAIPNGQEMALSIKTVSERIVSCIFSEFTSNVPNFNSRIGRHIKVALTSPKTFRIPSNIGSNTLPHGLRFHQYCFTIDGEMFEDTKNKEVPSYLDASTSGSDEENVSSPSPAVNVAEPLPGPSNERTPKQAFPTTHVPNQLGSGSRTISPLNSLVSIKEAFTKLGSNVNIIGVVKKATEARIFKTGNWGMELQVKDLSDYKHLEVKLYAMRREQLPDLKYGDGILLKQLQIRSRNGYAEGLGTPNSYRYCCLSKSTNKLYTSNEDAPIYHPTEEELHALKVLVNGGEVTRAARQEQDLDKIEDKRIEEIKHGDIFNCTALLLNVWTGERANVDVTDYTQNSLLRDPKSKWKFPQGNRTLRIFLHDDPAKQANTMEVGKIYYIPRVRFTESNGYSLGNCGVGKGVMPVISELNQGNPLVKNLLARKIAFESGKAIPAPNPNKDLHSESKQLGQPRMNVNPSGPDSTLSRPDAITSRPDSAPGGSKPLPVTTPNVSSAPVVPPVPSPPLKVYPKFPEFSGEIDICDSIECAAPDRHTLRTIQEIDDSPECPAIFRFHARTVDIQPSNLSDAVVAVCRECNATCTESSTEVCSSCKRQGTVQNQVRLEIVFQDASGLLKVRVGDEVAEKFFRLSKTALQAGNRERLLEELSDRFETMGLKPTPDKYEVGGFSEVMQVVIKSWQVREGPPGDATWYRRYKVSGCRVSLGAR